MDLISSKITFFSQVIKFSEKDSKLISTFKRKEGKIETEFAKYEICIIIY